MSMRSYGVETKSMVLTLDEFYSLLIHNRKEKIDDIDFDFMYDENNIPYSLHNVDYGDIMNVVDYIPNAVWFSEIQGTLMLFDENGYSAEYKCYDETLIIIELERNDLFHKYENFNEIYNELIDDLKEIGVIVDKDYVKKHFGMFRGTYIG